MKNKRISILSHIWLFIAVEILFVFIILKELPEISLVTTIWIIHLIYWLSIVVIWFFRIYIKKLWQKILATYLPVIFHILWHIYIGIVTVEYVTKEIDHTEHSLTWLIIATLSVGVIIIFGEWLLHKKVHCDNCHHEIHKDCKEGK